jgi:hypothetical protein
MIEIFAVMGCFYFVDPKWSKANACQLMHADKFTYRTKEECEDRIRQTFPDSFSKQSGSGARYSCVHKSVSTWSQ